MYNLGVSVTDSNNVEVEFIHCRNIGQQAEWLSYLREKHPNATVKPVFWKGGKWVAQ